jgi:hypothetical protein
VHLDQVEDPADVGRDHLARGADLASQQVEASFVLEEILAQRLQRHLDPQLEVEGPPHLTHPSPAELRANLVAVAQHLALSEEALGHGFSRCARNFAVYHSGTSAQPR